MSELPEPSVAGATIREDDSSAEALAEALIDRAQQHEDLEACVSFDPDAVRVNTRLANQRRSGGHEPGGLHGVLIFLKDYINTAWMPTTACTPARRGQRPKADAPVTAPLFGAGVILGVTCHNSSFGLPRDPYVVKVIVAGSSGGTATAVAARLSLAGVGAPTRWIGSRACRAPLPGEISA